MKRIFTVLLLVIAANLSAQSSSKDELAIVQSLYGKEKTDLIDLVMGLSDTEKKAFQPVYDAYESERKALGREKIRIINDYAANYENLTEEKADELTKANLKNNLDFEKLYSKTYGKVKKILGAKKASKFIQLETYLQTTIRFEIQDSIPFIDELDDMRKDD